MKASKAKEAGKVYTPRYIVANILDMCGYVEGSDILSKHVLEPSCGDGAFLTYVAERFIRTALCKGLEACVIRDALGLYLHGIELNAVEASKCRANLDEVASAYGIHGVLWDIECGDALRTTRFLGKMDFVVGNPPYVRVHNVADTQFLKNNYSFARGGMTDLYIAFYELGLYTLKDSGVLGYITPSSFFNSKAGCAMRDYLVHSRSLKAVVDFGHYQPFEAATYAAIVILTKSENRDVEFYKYAAEDKLPMGGCVLQYGDFLADDGTFLFAKDDMVFRILSSEGVRTRCSVKNGITTLLDEFFISDAFPFEDYTIPIVKASTGSQGRCIFPYDRLGKIVPLNALEGVTELNKRYLDYKERLLNRDLARNTLWHEFGRAQGIKDVFAPKYAVNALIRDERDIKLTLCPAGTGVYSGLYVVTDVSEEKLRSILVTPEFALYVKALGKFKSGGYYAYSSKELQLYLNYKLAEEVLLDA